MLISAVKDKVKDFIGTGQKKTVIKYVREQYPMSLEETSDWVEYLRGGTVANPPYSQKHQLLPTLPKRK